MSNFIYGPEGKVMTSSVIGVGRQKTLPFTQQTLFPKYDVVCYLTSGQTLVISRDETDNESKKRMHAVSTVLETWHKRRIQQQVTEEHQREVQRQYENDEFHNMMSQHSHQNPSINSLFGGNFKLHNHI